MSANVRSEPLRLATAIVVVAFLCACGGKVNGTYSGAGTGFFESLTFKSDGKVEITFMGMTKEGTYTVEDNKVKITNAGDTQVFMLDDKGCLNGGGLIGKYCKGGGGSAVTSLGGTYQATEGDTSITLRFQSDQKVRMTMSEGGRASESADGSYTVSGDRITVSVRGGNQMTLRRKGDDFVGSINGQSFMFIKR